MARLLAEPGPGVATEVGKRSGRQQRQNMPSSQAAAQDGTDTTVTHS